MNLFLRLAAAALPALCLSLPLPAMAELMLNPTRVVLANNQRATQVELINQGSEPATYRIGVVNRRMTETGEFVTIDTPGPDELFAGPMLTWSPRQITLAPGSAQVVRLMVRKPDGLAAGEYRSHLHFEKLPEPGDLASSVEAGQDDKRIGVVLKTLIGASIPVIVRHATAPAQVELTRLALQTSDSGTQLAFLIQRSGGESVYGDLAATLLAPDGSEKILARAAGVAVYTPNPLRRAALVLQLPPGATLARGKLRLTYHERPEAGGRLLAQSFLALP